MRRLMVAGKPKMPLPMIELMTSAVRLQRPMARTRLADGGGADVG